MNRRAFLSSLAASLLAGTVSGVPAQAQQSRWKAEFHAALKRHPWLLGYATAGQIEGHQKVLPVEGALPADLQGVLYRNGPAHHEISDMRYQHWFDGDGMVHAFRFKGETVTHLARTVQTAKFTEESKAGKALYPGFGTYQPGMKNVTKADDVNVANINIIRHGGELLALWEGGSAYRLDPETLHTLGLKTWSAATQGAPFGAHPRVDQDGSLWNIGYASTAGKLVLYRISPTGSLQATGVIDRDPLPMIHDFMLTERYLVLWLSPFFYKNHNAAFLDQFSWQPEAGSRIMVIDKNNFNIVSETEAPPHWIFHFSNAFETADGQIHFEAPAYTDPTVMTQLFRNIMRGQVTPFSGSSMTHAKLDPIRGKLEMQQISGLEGTEFPSIDPRFSGRAHDTVFAMQGLNTKERPGFNAVTGFQPGSGKIDRFVFPTDEIAEEHVFAASRQEAEPGFLIGTCLDIARAVTILNIFKANDLAAGPIARMPLEYPIPLGLHGNFYDLS